jgi:hypothetical protein
LSLHLEQGALLTLMILLQLELGVPSEEVRVPLLLRRWLRELRLLESRRGM